MLAGNRSIVLAIALFVVAAFAYGCQVREGSLPTEATRGVDTAAAGDEELADAIFQMIKDLLIDPAVGNSATSQFRNVVRTYAKDPAAAVTKAESLMDFIFTHYQNGKWPDPGGLGTGQLIAWIGAYVGSVQLADAAAACVPDVDCEISEITGSDFAGALVQGDLITQPFILYLTRLPDDFADPPLFPLFYEISTIPEGITFESTSPSGSLTLANDDQPFAAVCALDENDALGVPEDAMPGTNLFLAHFEDGEWETLPYVDPGSAFLDCSGATSVSEITSAPWMRPLEFAFAPALQILSPRPAYAAGTGLGGAISSFSEFGARYEGLIETTTTLSILEGETSFTEGETITLIASVSPTPLNEEDPEVTFFISTTEGGIIPGPTEPVVDGVAQHEFVCGTTVDFGSRTAGAVFQGTDTHEDSFSNILNFTCEEDGVDIG